MYLEYKKNIPKSKVQEILNKFDFEIDLDSSLDRDIEEYYYIKDIGYLVVFDFIDEGILYQCKQDYLNIVNDTIISSYKNVDFEEVILNKEKLIEELSLKFDLDISALDKIQKLEYVDMRLKSYDQKILQERFLQILAYFFTCLSNELRSNSWIFKKGEKGYMELVIIGTDNIEYNGFYGKLWQMIFEGEQELTLSYIANIVLYPNDFELSIDKN